VPKGFLRYLSENWHRRACEAFWLMLGVVIYLHMCLCELDQSRCLCLIVKSDGRMMSDSNF